MSTEPRGVSWLSSPSVLSFNNAADSARRQVHASLGAQDSLAKHVGEIPASDLAGSGAPQQSLVSYKMEVVVNVKVFSVISISGDGVKRRSAPASGSLAVDLRKPSDRLKQQLQARIDGNNAAMNGKQLPNARAPGYRKIPSKFTDCCLIDALRALGNKISYAGDGPFQIRDGMNWLHPLGTVLRKITNGARAICKRLISIQSFL